MDRGLELKETMGGKGIRDFVDKYGIEPPPLFSLFNLKILQSFSDR